MPGLSVQPVTPLAGFEIRDLDSRRLNALLTESSPTYIYHFSPSFLVAFLMK